MRDAFRPSFFLMALLVFLLRNSVSAQLTGTALLQSAAGDVRSKAMVAGLDRFLTRAVDGSEALRAPLWKRDLSSVNAYNHSVESNREHLRQILGVVKEDQRASLTALERVCTTEHDAKLAETPEYTLHAVRWPVLRGVSGEGLLLRPKGKVRARIILLPDADQTPEMLAGLAEGLAPDSWAPLRLAQLGCEVVVPVLINRGSYLFSGEWEISEWNLGRTFSYAEMAALIAPRPFMVERGRDDGCGRDEWVAGEYSKVDRLYGRLGLNGMAVIEYFNGPHTINGKATFEFLHKHLDRPQVMP